MVENRYGRIIIFLPCMEIVGNHGELNAGAVFLASEEAFYVTGAVFAIDGGYTAI